MTDLLKRLPKAGKASKAFFLLVAEHRECVGICDERNSNSIGGSI